MATVPSVEDADSEVCGEGLGDVVGAEGAEDRMDNGQGQRDAEMALF